MENKNKIGYSFWGIVASMVGVSIGIGIFVRVPQIVDSNNGSELFSIIA
jgi:SNF family Na+-dependent transporter